jgi:hypothetical protein
VDGIDFGLLMNPLGEPWLRRPAGWRRSRRRLIATGNTGGYFLAPAAARDDGSGLLEPKRPR